MLWLPGNGSLPESPTQAKVDERFEKRRHFSFMISGVKTFLKRAWEWKEEYASTIRKQWAKMGLSLDYSRERFYFR